MKWFWGLSHALIYADTSFVTMKSMGFSWTIAILLAVGSSSIVFFGMSMVNRLGLNLMSRRPGQLGRFQMRLAVGISNAGFWISKRLGFKFFSNGNGNHFKIQEHVNLISYRIVDRLGYMGVVALVLIPFVPFTKEAGLAGGQLIKLKYAIPVAMIANVVRIIVLFCSFY